MKKSSNQVFIVTAHRWGYRESHNYIVGVYSSEEKATQSSKEEEHMRGGKYECRIVELKIDDYKHRRILKILSQESFSQDGKHE